MAPGTLFHQPDKAAIEAANITQFARFVDENHHLKLDSYWKLHEWSCQYPALFWSAIWDYFTIIGHKGELFAQSASMTAFRTRLPTTKLNYAENLLLSHKNALSDRIAIYSCVEGVSQAERPRVTATYTWKELHNETCAAAKALYKLGVRPGDSVSAYTPTNCENVIMMLGAAAIGGVWSCVAAEVGTEAALERLEQTKPKILLVADSYQYAHKQVDLRSKNEAIISRLAKTGLRHAVTVKQLESGAARNSHAQSLSTKKPFAFETLSFPEFIKTGRTQQRFDFWRGPAMAPLFVLFSSGTTGKPKAIVHHAGGIILAQKMTNGLHHDMGPSDCCLQFTTPSWMMWNVAVSMLAVGSSTVMYDGSPLSPMSTLWDLVEDLKATYLGCSPRYLQILDNAAYEPKKTHKLTSLRTMQLAGAPLRPSLSDFIRNSIKSDIYLNNASGGTDICGCFVGSVPSVPLYYGEIPVPILGMRIEAWDDEGRSVQQGTMICTTSFPNQPLQFLDDPQDKRYKSTYYEDFLPAQVWNQSDFINIDPKTGSIAMLGRADGVLNPQGVRFGSAELYTILEPMTDVFEDCIAVGRRTLEEDEEVLLFVKMRDSVALDDELRHRLKTTISSRLSPRHVPAHIISCPEIPYTQTFKKVEVAVKKIVNGTDLSKINTSAVVNPQALTWFSQFSRKRESKL